MIWKEVTGVMEDHHETLMELKSTPPNDDEWKTIFD